MIFTES